MSNEPAFARSTGLPPEMGKATSEIKCKVPDVVKDDLVRLAHSMGLTESLVLRELVLVRLYGRDKVQRMRLQQLELVAGISPESGPAA